MARNLCCCHAFTVKSTLHVLHPVTSFFFFLRRCRAPRIPTRSHHMADVNVQPDGSNDDKNTPAFVSKNFAGTLVDPITVRTPISYVRSSFYCCC